MYKEILIATDGSELANRALAHGLKLANEVKARVTIVTVTPPWSALDLAHEACLRKPDPIHQFEEMAGGISQSDSRRCSANSENGWRCLRTRTCSGTASG
jgi:Universal stress protein family